MKKMVRLLTPFFLFLTASKAASGQDLTGIWRGYFITEFGDQYKYEVQLDQSTKNTVKGVTYSYLDTRFYGKATLTGNFTKASQTALVQEIKTVELKMSSGSVACIMKCRLVYSRSGREEFLEGTYTSGYEQSDPVNGIRRGADCGGGKVYLRKVATSDFYVEPFLRKKTTKKEDPRGETAKTNVPPKKETPPSASRPVAKPRKDTVAKKPVATTVVAETAKKKPVEEVALQTKTVAPKITPTPPTIRERKNELAKTFTVYSEEIEISFVDNGQVDDDTISIYHNGALVLAKKRLSNKPIVYKIQLNESSPEHTVVMVAENLGLVPPNTSLMLINDGGKLHEVAITSTEQKNAMVRLRYGKKE